MDGGSAFSGPIIVLMVVILLVGAVVGFMVSSSANTRQLYTMQTNDASQLRENLKPKIAAFKETHAKILKLSPKSVSYDGAAELSKAEFEVTGAVFPSNRLLLGGEAISLITQFMTDTNDLKAMLKEHDRLTNKVDQAEIKELLESNKEQLSAKLGVLFDYQGVIKNAKNEEYLAKEGSIVRFKGTKEDDKGKLRVEQLSTGNELEVEKRNFIPLNTSQILRTGGSNALSRYEYRVKLILFKSTEIEKYADSVIKALDKLADRESAPILQFTSE